MNEKRTMRIFTVLIMITVLIVSGILASFHSGDKFIFIADSCAYEKGVYVVNDDGENINIINMNLDGRILDKIHEKKIKGSHISTYKYLNIDDNKVYVYKMDKDIVSNRVETEGVYLCNFAKNKLEKEWELPLGDSSAQSNFNIAVRGGNLTYFTVGYDNKQFTAQAVLHKFLKNAKEPEKAAVVNYDLAIGFTDFFYGDNGSIVFTTPKGEIYKAVNPNMVRENIDENIDKSVNKNKKTDINVEAIADKQMQEPKRKSVKKEIPVYTAVKLYPAEGADGANSLVNFTSDGKHTLYFMDLKAQGIAALNLSDDSNRIVIDGWNKINADRGIKESDLINVRFTDNSHFTATVNLDKNKGILGVYDNKGMKVFEKAMPGIGGILKSAAFYFICIMGTMLLVGAFIRIVFMLAGGKFPIVAKVIGLCIPVLIAGILLLQGVMNTIYIGQITDNQYKELYLISRQQIESISSELLSEIDLKNPYEQVYYYELRRILTALPSKSTVYEAAQDKKGKRVYDFGYHWLYKLDQGKLVSVFTDQNYIGLPIEYYYDRNTSQMFYDAAKTGKTYRGSFRDAGGEWICLAIPVFDDKGHVTGVMETGTTKNSLEYAVKENTKEINLINFIFLIVLIGLLVLLLLISLAPLKALKESIKAIIHGNLGIQARVKGNDEIAEITQVFNQMSSSIDYHVKELSALNEGYFKFVPAKIFKILRKGSVIDVKLGDQMNSDITILSFNVVDFDKMISSMNSQQMFIFINEIYSRLVPVVSSKDGVVDKFEEAGLVAFYTNNSEQALDTAVSVCQAMEILNGKRLASGLTQIELTSGISFGPAMLGIVGHGKRLAATTVSEHTNLSGFLRKIAPKYCSRILTTATTVNEIQEFDKKFNFRVIGFLHITANNSVEKIIDVFDGDREDIRLLKRQTKVLFERGVELYCQKDFYEARLVFIDILKQFRQDTAAKEYLYRCDCYYQRENSSDVENYIEEY